MKKFVSIQMLQVAPGSASLEVCEDGQDTCAAQVIAQSDLSQLGSWAFIAGALPHINQQDSNDQKVPKAPLLK